MPWLYDILKDGTLLDNQTYSARDGSLSNWRWTQCVALNQAGKRTQPKHWEGDIWRFLNKTARDVSELLKNCTSDSVVLFNHENYEHNTSDEFIQVSGVDARNFTLTTGNLVGYVKRGDYSLKISSRFGDSFLKYIIADADGFLEMEDYGGDENGDYEWLLVYLWLIKLKRAYRLGLPKSYVTKTETMPKVRGRIHPVEYSLHADRAAYKCTYREHSYCNPATILIAETFRKLKNHPFVSEANAISHVFAVASEGKRSDRRTLLNTPDFKNPFYSDYNSLIDLSKKILRNESADVGERSDNSAFFFDVSMLFEYFIRKLLKRTGALFHPKKDPRFKIPAGRKGNALYSLQPDLFFAIADRMHLFDVKYKSYNFINGVDREDLFQLHTYLGQCANHHEIASCGLIYPLSEERWISQGLEATNGCIDDMIRFSGRLIPFRVIFIKVPGAPQNFNRRFSESCQKFLEHFKIEELYRPNHDQLSY
jgi:5-methylcytosine-specific restriction enzyme subunit McrC